MSLISEYLADSPVAVWELDEVAGTNADDATANNLDLTYTNSPTLGVASIIPAVATTCVDFDGTNDTCIGPTGGLLQRTTQTMEAWIKLDAKPSVINTKYCVMGKPGQASMWVYNLSGGDTNRLMINCGGTNLWGTTNLQIGVLYQVVVVCPAFGAGDREVWVNGVKEANAASPGVTANANAFRVGDEGGNFFNGKIQYAAVFPTALSSSRIQAHYLAGTSVSTSRTATDSVSVSDSATRVLALARTATDTAVTVSDAVARAAMSRARTATDTVTVSDAAARIVTTARTAADSVTVATDTATRAAMSKARTAGDTVTVSDTATRAAMSRARTAADSVSVSDAASRILAAARTGADAVTVAADTATRIVAVARTAGDSVSVSDSVARASISRARTAGDSVSVSDAATRLLALARSAADSVSVSDSAVATRGVSRSAADTVTVLDDTAGRVLLLVRTADDLVTLTDAASRGTLSLVRTAGDVVLVTDEARKVNHYATAQDVVYVFDTATGHVVRIGDHPGRLEGLAGALTAVEGRAGGRGRLEAVVSATPDTIDGR